MEAIRAAEDTGEVAEVLRFPLSLGSFRVDVDKKGEACHVLDIVLNPDVLKQAQAFRQVEFCPCDANQQRHISGCMHAHCTRHTLLGVPACNVMGMLCTSTETCCRHCVGSVGPAPPRGSPTPWKPSI